MPSTRSHILYLPRHPTSQEKRGAGTPVEIGLVKEYVRNSIFENVTVESVASHFKYNRDYLGKLFKKHTGVSLKAYIAKKKLTIAENLLLTTDMSIKEIAAKLGYPEENLFIKFFIYHEKISPKKFKNKYFNTHMNHK